MSHDLQFAASHFFHDIDDLISALEGCLLHRDLKDQEALEIAIHDLVSAKLHLMLALVGEEVAH